MKGTYNISEPLRFRCQNVKCLFVDLDGTALNDHALLSPETLSALTDWKKEYPLYIASGRPSYLLEYYMKQLELNELAVTSNGALIYDPVTAGTLMMHTVPEAISRDYIAFAWKQQLDFTIFTEKKIYLTNYSIRKPRYEHYNSLSKTNPAIPPARVITYSTLEDFYKIPFDKVLRLSTLVQTSQEQAKIQEYARNLQCVSASQSSFDVFDIYSDQADKWDAILWLCKQKNIPIEGICVIGNDGNDLQMIKSAPLSFCVANAIPEVKAAADYILPSNNQNGVAYAIQKLLLSQRF